MSAKQIMLVNVKFFKIFIFFILLSVNLSANEKDQILAKLNNLNSLEFTFDQVINDKVEKRNCLLEFPGKLKCNYFDDKKKELVINNRKATNIKNGDNMTSKANAISLFIIISKIHPTIH